MSSAAEVREILGGSGASNSNDNAAKPTSIPEVVKPTTGGSEANNGDHSASTVKSTLSNHGSIASQPFQLRPPPPPKNRSSQQTIQFASTTSKGDESPSTTNISGNDISDGNGPAQSSPAPPAPTGEVQTASQRLEAESLRQSQEVATIHEESAELTLRRKSLQGKKKERDLPGTIDGIPREVYALIGDNAPNLQQVKKDFLNKKSSVGRGGIKDRDGPKVKWIWQSFTPAHHPTSRPTVRKPTKDSHGSSVAEFKLGHWIKCLEDQPVQASDPYAPYGSATAAPNVMLYTQWEYDHYLGDPGWTADETAYLWSLLQAYDLRFQIVADRYAYLPPGGRSGQDPSRYSWPPPLVSRKAKKPARGTGERRATRSAATPLSTHTSTNKNPGVTSAGSSSRLSTPVADSAMDVDEPRPQTIHTDVRTRSVEEIKHRYFTICRKLIRARPAADEAAREKLIKAYDFDPNREMARKRHLESLFHLSRAQIAEEEALYVELRRMEAVERKYKAQREDLMKVLAGLESGVVAPSLPDDGVPPLGPNGEVVKVGAGNRVFSNGSSFGVGVNRTMDGILVGGGADKSKKRKRQEEAAAAASGVNDSGNRTPTATSALPASQAVPSTAASGSVAPQSPGPAAAPPAVDQPMSDAEFELIHCITRFNPSAQLIAPGIATSRAVHIPAHLRSGRLPISTGAKPSTNARVQEILRRYGVNPDRLIMPTTRNIGRLEALVQTAHALVDLKSLVDKMEMEVKVTKAQLGISDGPTSQAQ